MCSLLLVSFIPFPSEIFLSDLTSEPLFLSVNFYLRTSFFLYDFTSEPPSFCQILPQNYLPSVRFYLRTPIFIFSNVLSDLIFSTIPCPVVQSLSRVQLFVTPQTAAHRASPSFTISQSLLKLMSIKSMMPPNHHNPLLPTFPLVFNLSQHQSLFQ